MKYYRPTSTTEYFDLRTALAGQDIMVLAGGTDLVPRFERGTPLPEHLIDIKNLPDFSGIQENKDDTIIGALTTIEEIHRSDLIHREYRALFQAAYEFAGTQIRHRATLGGNICNASPAGDMLPGLYVYDTRVCLSGIQGERILPLSKFILGPGKVDLQPDELLKSVILPRQDLDSGFIKVGLRQAMAISVVNVALSHKVNGKGLYHLKIAAGAVAPTVVMLDSFSSAVLNSPAELSAHMDMIDEAISPIDDIRATASYRRTVLKNLVRESIEQLMHIT